MSLEAVLIWLFGALVGSMLFFALTVAPTVFRAIPGDHAGRFLRAFFPQYYLWGASVALLCLLVAFGAGGNHWLLTACIAVLGLFVYARQWLMPAINRARDREIGGDDAAAGKFRSLHLQSVIINALQLVLLIAATIYLLQV